MPPEIPTYLMNICRLTLCLITCAGQGHAEGVVAQEVQVQQGEQVLAAHAEAGGQEHEADAVEHAAANEQAGVAEQADAGQEEALDAANAAADGPPAVETVKVAWGTMWTCCCVECQDGSTEYSSFVPTGPEEEPHPHCLPSLLRKDPAAEPFLYAIELKHVQATCLNGKVSFEGGAAPEQVFAPYRPVGSHG
jgi:hypothetical protein